jgi:protein-L-isoaspartate O-methyltransferase
VQQSGNTRLEFGGFDMLSRVIQLWKSFVRAESKSQWIRRKIVNRLARSKIEAAWQEFVERLPREQLINQEFDRRHGTDTAEEVHLIDTGVPAEDVLRGMTTYRPVWEADFHAALAALKTTFEGFTFVDIGCGKGKMMMMAAERPFARIVGVEYSPGLHAIAQRNLKIYQSPTQRCRDLESVLGDALNYRLPDGPIVCLIFNALDAQTLRKFMRQVEDDLSSRAEPAYVIYCNLRHVAEIGDGLDSVRKLKCLRKSEKIVVFGNAPAANLFRRA